MAEVSLSVAVDKLHSDRQKDRSDGVNQLKEIFTTNRSSPKLDAINNSRYSTIFQALFAAAAAENQVFTKSARSGAIRLSSCAAVLRLVVAAGVQKLKPNTVWLIATHIIEALDGRPKHYEPLSLDYIKTLLVILTHQPHVEHFTHEKWIWLVEFCCRGTKGVTADLILCLEELTKAPNAPILERGELILSTLLEYVSHTKNAGRSQQGAIAAINIILSRFSVYDVELAQKTVYYFRRTDRDQLQLEDVVFMSPGDAFESPLTFRSMSLRGGCIRSEQSWAILDCMATIHHLAGVLRPGNEDDDDVDAIADDAPPNKRRRVQSHRDNEGVLVDVKSDLQPSMRSATHDNSRTSDGPERRRRVPSYMNTVIDQLASQNVSEKLCASQVLTFMLCQRPMVASDCEMLVARILRYMSDENTAVASWSMLSISQCIVQSDGDFIDEASWLQIWQVTLRGISTPGTCRAACVLMTTLVRSNAPSDTVIAEHVDALLASVELNGPAVLVDTALSLWTTILTHQRSRISGDSARDSIKVVKWLCSNWTPGRLMDRTVASLHAQHARPLAMMELLSIIAGQSPTMDTLSRSDQLPCGRIAQFRRHVLRNESLLNYLLSDGSSSSQYPLHDMTIQAAPPASDQGRDKSALSAAQKMLVEHCTLEFDHLRSMWQAQVAERAQHITADMIRALTSVCIIGAALNLRSVAQHGHVTAELARQSELLGQALVSYLSRSDCSPALIDVVLEVIQPVIYDPCPDDLSSRPTPRLADVRLLSELSRVLEARENDAQNGIEIGDDDDVMDLYDNDSQPSLRHQGTGDISLPRTDEAADSNSRFCVRDVRARLKFVTSTPANITSSEQAAINFGRFVEYVTQLDTPDFLGCRRLLSSITRLPRCLTRSDAEKIIGYLIQNVLPSYEHERCEVSLGICIDIMTGLADLWSQDVSDALSEASFAMYEWFVVIALDKNIFSPNVQVRLAKLLHRLLKLQPKYGSEKGLVSVRTSLFTILQCGDVLVQFRVAETLPQMFGLFSADQHEAIFEDIVSSLPTDTDSSSGVAMRLLVLGRIAAKWPTLLRLSIYRIFEVMAQSEKAIGHIRHCLSELSEALKLAGPSELSKLFLPQLLYTWIERESLQSLPYAFFGFETFRGFLADEQKEVSAQLIMYGDEVALQSVAELLRKSVEDLLIGSFDKVAAYSIARDISLPRAADTTARIGSEQLIRKLLGDEKYIALVYSRFAHILVLLLLCVDEEHQIEKAFAKNPSYCDAHRILQEIRSSGSSERVLPNNLQPCFRASLWVNQVEHLCRRARHQSSGIWTASMVAFILRKLLDSIHPALGSLHTCSVIRKIRILVCVAGKTATEGYPLEKSLHSLRPYLADVRCADDTIGLLKYLLQAGKEYLSQVPSFTLGLALSVFASLQKLQVSSLGRTVQDGHFQNTLSRAQSFRRWLGSYLDMYSTPLLRGPSDDAFRAMLRAAREIEAQGNAVDGTNEGTMLTELLEDEKSGRNLLAQPSQDQAFTLLCSDFQRPDSFQRDIFGSDVKSAAYAVTAWKSCQRKGASMAYKQWVGRVLGRAYASTGEVPKDMLQESDLNRVEERCHGDSKSATGSKPAILRTLQDLTLADRHADANIAEETLQTVVSRLALPEDLTQCQHTIQNSLYAALLWENVPVPLSDRSMPPSAALRIVMMRHAEMLFEDWTKAMCLSLASAANDDPILGSLPYALQQVAGLARQVFSYLLHLVLLQEQGSEQAVRKEISSVLGGMLCTGGASEHVKMILTAILYLQTQPIPHETTKADRKKWLDVNFGEAANAAARCKMYKSSLLFLELHTSQSGRWKASPFSAVDVDIKPLLLTIYKNVDEPDSYYGVRQDANLQSMMDRLQYEIDGPKSLSFASAHFDAHIRLADESSSSISSAMVRALGDMNLDGLNFSLLQGQKRLETSDLNQDIVIKAARKLERWDLPVPPRYRSEEATIYRAFECINHIGERQTLTVALDKVFSGVMAEVTGQKQTGPAMKVLLRSLAVLTEIDEFLTFQGPDQLEEAWDRMQARNGWMWTGRHEDGDQIMTARGTLLSSFGRRAHLRSMTGSSLNEVRLIEVKSLLELSRLSRNHHAIQTSLSTTTYLSELIKPCLEIGLAVDSAAQFESSNVLWDQGEMNASIQMLQDLKGSLQPEGQAVRVGRAELLAKLGHRVSEARLEKPDEIISRYLLPALEELRGGASGGDEAGTVYHEFASFCDGQLQDVDNLEEFERVRTLRNQKEAEVRGLEKMLKSANSQSKASVQSHLTKATQWYNLDDREFQRLRASRNAFLKQSLENYLLCLKSSESFNNDVLRFCALWLEQANNEIANKAVARFISDVPSRKMAPLMNQLSSRLLETDDEFQTLLFQLVLRICIDHPYHGMYQIFSTSRGRSKGEQAVSRVAASVKLISRLKKHVSASRTWAAVHNTNHHYARLAAEKLDSKYKAGARIQIRKSALLTKMEHEIPKLGVPPLTMVIALRPDCDYSKTATITRFSSEFSVAGGLSAPKIITVIASDGVRYKQLVKGGNDDLRQDAIMEQVFDQVSSLLRNDRATRQRKLGIRTYKVLPLTTNTGVIEFVPNTIPLHDYLMPAHQRHFPHDWKNHACRKQIHDVSSKSGEVRLKAYRQVTEHFHPVLHHFFLERFSNPDDWFEKRLAYSRSTATISILGHVLGLGDRHGHNVLLDETTGEVIHIDLGVAFEQGRVLTIPEVVPFRLTRDIVDGMGITKTEGVFRRCCEFTLDALRKETYSIMTILDVLRYDPLYSWTVSPLRAKKMQEEQDDRAEDGSNEVDSRDASSKVDESSEAARALTVVAKKLSKTLSVTAMVNELIQQATDERNLALLFSGWAAYA
ncbi:MAG: hypothetical protein M1825_003430 [Sarcosagium campestre]|nr:MAG: hypothetical protein M1825_003430 [Sarcosagium campestre]